MMEHEKNVRIDVDVTINGDAILRLNYSGLCLLIYALEEADTVTQGKVKPHMTLAILKVLEVLHTAGSDINRTLS